MSFLKLHHISFRIVAVAYAMPLKDPLTLRRTNTTSEVKHRAPRASQRKCFPRQTPVLLVFGPCELADRLCE